MGPKVQHFTLVEMKIKEDGVLPGVLFIVTASFILMICRRRFEFTSFDGEYSDKCD